MSEIKCILVRCFFYCCTQFSMKKNINTTFFWCLCGSCSCWKPWRTHSCKLGVAQNIVTDIGMGSKWQLWAWTHHPWLSSMLCKQEINDRNSLLTQCVCLWSILHQLAFSLIIYIFFNAESDLKFKFVSY